MEPNKQNNITVNKIADVPGKILNKTNYKIISKYFRQLGKHWPAKLFDGADINNSVVEMVHKLWHVLFKKPPVCMHRVTYRKKNHGTLP